MVAACIFAAIPRSGAAQQKPSSTPRTTLTGVYTLDQASRGRDVYATLCTSCHNVASHSGAVFWKSWGGKTLSDLYKYVSQQMPKNEPGSLTPEEYSVLVAYLLRVNGMPYGDAELPADTLPLSRIRIEPRKPNE